MFLNEKNHRLTLLLAIIMLVVVGVGSPVAIAAETDDIILDEVIIPEEDDISELDSLITDKESEIAISVEDIEQQAKPGLLEETESDQKEIILMIGDSYAAGVETPYMGLVESNNSYWPGYLSELIPGDAFYLYGRSGAGFIQKADKYENFTSLLTKAYVGINDRSDVVRVIAAGGYNDRSYTRESLIEAVVAFTTQAKEYFPNAEVDIAMIGWRNGTDDFSEVVRRQLCETVEPAYREGVRYEGGTYINHASSALRTEGELLGTDHVHPTNEGQKAIASVLAAFLNGEGSESVNVTYRHRDGSLIDEVTTCADDFFLTDQYGNNVSVSGWSTVKSETTPEVLAGSEVSVEWVDDNYPSIDLYAIYETEDKTFNGFKEIGQSWYCFKDGVVIGGVPDVVEGQVQGQNGWWYVDQSGKVDFTYTGFAKNENGWWYCKNGVVDFSIDNCMISGKANSINASWYVDNNKVVVPAVINVGNKWGYVDKNYNINTSYTGFGQNANGWWYIEDGVVTFKKTDVINGTVKYQSAWWNVINSKVTPGPTVSKNANGWWYVDQSGKVDFSYTGFANNKNGIWYVNKGKVNFAVDGVYYGRINGDNGWYHVVKSKYTKGVTVARNQNGWWYIDSNGRVDFGFTGIASNQNGAWYIKNGKVQFDYSGLVRYQKKVYRIKKGKVVK